MSAKIIPVEPFDLTVFGATSDLARRKLLPGLYHRDRDRQLPPECRIIGVARRDLGSEVLSALTHAIRNSIDHAISNRDETFSTMRQHAQELDDDVIAAHVDLYVNEWTRDMGAEGRAALDALGS